MKTQIGIRVFNEGPSVDEWYAKHHDPSSLFDVCIDCKDEMEDDPEGTHKHPNLQPYNGEPVGETWNFVEEWGVDYDERGYKCDLCGVRLRNK